MSRLAHPVVPGKPHPFIQRDDRRVAGCIGKPGEGRLEAMRSPLLKFEIEVLPDYVSAEGKRPPIFFDNLNLYARDSNGSIAP